MTVPIRVLLVEDSEDDALLLLGELRRGGFAPRAERAETAGELRAALDGGRFDVVIADYDLGDFTGLDALGMVQGFDPDLPFILVSKVIGEERAIEAMRAGARDFVGKLHPVRLAAAVERELRDAEVRRSRRSADAALRTLHETHDLLLASVGDGIYGMDPDGRCTFLNPAGARLLGYEPRDLIGQALHPRIHHTHAGGQPYAIESCPLVGVLGTGTPRHVADEVLWRKDGTSFPADYLASPIVRDGAVLGAVVVFRDVTERRRHLEDLTRARDEALESARLKSAFLANMGHEVRTPLNVILGHSELLADVLAPSADDTVRSVLRGIRSAGARLLDTIVAVLDLSKLETGTMSAYPESIDVAELTRRLIRAIEPAATAKGLTLHTHLPDHAALALLDEYSFTQAVRQILGNAVKFTAAGSITVELLGEAEGGLRLEVRDTGIGIEPSFLPSIGGLFVQEQMGNARPYEGSGAGLALAKRFLALSGAELSVESRKGWGSVFRIHLPPARVAGAGMSALAMETASGGDGRALVLVLEDGPVNAKLASRVLDGHYEVLVAAGAEEAWRHITAEGPRIRVILVDLSPKGREDGLAIARRLREMPAWKETAIIATAAQASPADRRDALAAGCMHYLTKPFAPATLLALVELALARPG